MAAYIVDAYDWLVAALEDAGVTVVTDPRNVRPPCVMVEPPTIASNQNKTLAQLDFPITVMAPPPGNRDTLNWLLTTVDDIIATVGPTTGGPQPITIGNQDLPAYQLTATIQIRRN